MENGLLIEHVTVGYHADKNAPPVLRELSLRIAQGETLALLGASGSGKSTLISLLAGVLQADSGSITLCADGVCRPLNPRTHSIGLLPQSRGLLPWKTVEENCLLPLRLRGERLPAERKSEMAEIYHALDLQLLLKRYPATLSGGQYQRAVIARALIQRPSLLLMDEPFSALDELTREQAWVLFLRLWQKKRPAALLVTHSIDEALFLGCSVAVMSAQSGVVSMRRENPLFGKPNPCGEQLRALRNELRELLRREERHNDA